VDCHLTSWQCPAQLSFTDSCLIQEYNTKNKQNVFTIAWSGINKAVHYRQRFDTFVPWLPITDSVSLDCRSVDQMTAPTDLLNYSRHNGKDAQNRCNRGKS